MAPDFTLVDVDPPNFASPWIPDDALAKAVPAIEHQLSLQPHLPNFLLDVCNLMHQVVVNPLCKSGEQEKSI